MRLRDSQYYQHLHASEAAYQTNNWLMEEWPFIRALGTGTLIEVGCGNGRFLGQAAGGFRQVYGIDWARSPLIDDILAAHPNVHFLCRNVIRQDIPVTGDIVVSADFLEHLPPHELETIIRKLDALADAAFHKVACYDDGHSHDSILSPEEWITLFQRVNPTYRLVKASFRHGDATKVVAVFIKRGRETDGIRHTGP